MSKLFTFIIPVLLTFNILFAHASDQEIIRPKINKEEIKHSIYRYESNNSNNLKVINIGIEALATRLDMIERAKETINLEYFIFNPDTAGRIVLQALAQKAQEGVKIKILIDKSAAVFKLHEFYALVLKEKNISLRYYNPTSNLQLSSLNFRNHRKMLSIDNREAITGGRNMADEYFDLSTTFNFLDRDIWIKGPIVKIMNQTFDKFWNSKITEIPKVPFKPNAQIMPGNDEISRKFAKEHKSYIRYMKKYNQALDIFKINKKDTQVLDFINSYGISLMNNNQAELCPKLSFATDKEGGAFKERIKSKKYHREYRLLRKEIQKWIGKVKDQIILDSPYFLTNKRSKHALKDLLEGNKKVTIFTNSLGSTDAVYVSTVFSDSVKKYTRNGLFNAYLLKGKYTNESELLNDNVRNSSWGTHSKTIIFNNQAFMIGTFNIDNRSSFYNTEMAIFCEGSRSLTSKILQNIEKRKEYSMHLNNKGLPDDGTDLLQGTSFGKKLLYFFLKIPSHLGAFLL